MRRLIVACWAVLLAGLEGCSSLGPAAIQQSRTNYNVVLQQTSDQQLLLNLVRLRYRDRPLFLETSALNTQFRFSPSVSASIYGGGNQSTSGSAAAEFKYEEKPTVTYTPLQGQAYVQRVMSPVSWQTLQLLDNVGWRSDRLLRVVVQRINDLGNAETASGPTPRLAPQYRAFNEAASLYQWLKERGLLRSYSARKGDRVTQMIEFDQSARGLPQYRRFIELVGLEAAQRRYEILLNNPLRVDSALQVQTRSFMGILYFLSQSVDVPQVDQFAGRVTRTLDAKGQPFDWGEVTRGLMHIASSAEEPENAAVKVHYRGHWFYIDDSDLESKSTFVLLGQLFALQAGEVKNAGPVLTLPVGN